MTRSQRLFAPLLLPCLWLGAMAWPVGLAPQGPGGASPRENAELWVPTAGEGGSGATGVLRLEYGAVPFSPELEELVVDSAGSNWSMGNGFWSSLDTSVPLRFHSAMGGRVEVPPGHYYLTLRRGPDVPARETLGPPAVWILSLFDPGPIHAARLTPRNAAELRGGIQIPLARRDPPQKASRLTVAIDLLDRQREPRSPQGMVRIDFGGHRFQGVFEVAREDPAPYLPDTGTRLHPQDRYVLEHADSLRILALRPTPNSLLADGGGDPGPSVMGYGILGEADVTDPAERTRVLQWVYRAVAGDFSGQARCFMPRHGVVARVGEQEVTILMCFACNNWRGSGLEGSLGGQMSPVDEAAVNRFWKGKGLEVAD